MKINNFDVKGVDTLDDVTRFLSNTIGQIVTAINGKIALNENIDGRLVTVSFTSANVDTAATHNLGRNAIGYLVVASSAAALVYAGSIAANNNTIFLKASAPATVTLLVF